jgi:hypothetical protein
MTRHLADKRAPGGTGRLRHFLRIAREGGEGLWRGLWKAPRTAPATGRRVAEFARIERGRSV